MRIYHWNNSYTAGGQNSGIQTAHSQMGMVEKWGNHPYVQEFIKDKTTVVLRGGNHQFLVELEEFLSMGYLPYYGFRESMESLNGAMTDVCVIPTESIVSAASVVRRGGRSSVIIYDNKLTVGVDENSEYTTIEKRYRNMMAQSVAELPEGYDNTLDYVRDQIRTETFTAWETELILRISRGVLA